MGGNGMGGNEMGGNEMGGDEMGRMGRTAGEINLGECGIICNFAKVN